MLTGLKRKHVLLVAGYWVRFSLRTGGGLMALLVVLITGLSIAAAFVSPVEALMEASPELGHSPGEAARWVDKISRSDQFVDLVRRVTDSDEEQVAYLLQEQPALLSAIWIVLLIAYPFVICIVAFNQTAGDIGSRGLRYLLLRTERANIFLGRFVGTLYYAALSTGLLFVLLVLYIGIKFNIYPAGQMAWWGVQGYVAVLLLSLPYVAMCAWMSGLLDTAFGSLAICLLLTGFPLVFIKLANVAAKGDLDWADRLLPWGWKYELLSGDVGERLIAYAAMGAFTALFLWLGLRSFAKRDL